MTYLPRRIYTNSCDLLRGLSRYCPHVCPLTHDVIKLCAQASGYRQTTFLSPRIKLIVQIDLTLIARGPTLVVRI